MMAADAEEFRIRIGHLVNRLRHEARKLESIGQADDDLQEGLRVGRKMAFVDIADAIVACNTRPQTKTKERVTECPICREPRQGRARCKQCGVPFQSD